MFDLGKFSKKLTLPLLASYSPLAMSTHLLRVRDTLFSNLAGIASSATYDPTSLSISAGSTIFQQIRGELPEEPVVVEESEEGA